METPLKLKKGDTVYVKLPMNAKIVSVNKRIGYTLQTPDGTRWSYFDDSDCEKIKGK